MGQRRFAARWLTPLAVAGVVGLTLAGCGDDGEGGTAGSPGVVIAPIADATALNITVTGVTVASPPVVTFRVTDQNGDSVTGLAADDVRFTIAKLVPGTGGNPSAWQSYVNNSSGQATRETPTTASFRDNGNGTYTYTFQTDITNVTAPVRVAYDPNLTHRVGIQTRGSLPMVNAAYTFRPSDGATSGLFSREIVTTAKCNQCHNQLEAHDQRIETQYCVTCHNPGSSDPDTGNTVDFKVMIHKIHMGEELPSVRAGGSYRIIGFNNTVFDYSTVVFPQDIRNCTKCHDGADSATPQGDDWKTRPSREACGSCHDNVNFVTGAGHAGGPKDNSTCLACHSTGGEVGPVAASHTIPVKAETARYQFNLLNVTGATTPVIQFSVTDPTNSNVAYDIASGDAATNPRFKTPGTSRLAITIGWATGDFTNEGSGSSPAQPISIDPVNACDGTPIADWSCTIAANVYTLTKLSALPLTATGTGRVGFEGHPAAQDSAGAWTVPVPVKNAYRNFVISGTSTDRRLVVDIAKCNNCHDRLSLHGDNRTDEPQVCVMCHNPNATDKTKRPGAGGIDGKLEESIDFKRMIHAIHAGQKDDPATTGVVEGRGFREKGIVVYGFCFPAPCVGPAFDFSQVRFPGRLSDCAACHLPGTYELSGRWAEPVQAGAILASTVNTGADLTVSSDDLNISPTAAVCSSCHDGAAAAAHMVSQGLAVGVGTVPPNTQANIGTGFELCSTCHGPGRTLDVKVVHGVR